MTQSSARCRFPRLSQAHQHHGCVAVPWTRIYPEVGDRTERHDIDQQFRVQRSQQRPVPVLVKSRQMQRGTTSNLPAVTVLLNPDSGLVLDNPDLCASADFQTDGITFRLKTFTLNFPLLHRFAGLRVKQQAAAQVDKLPTVSHSEQHKGGRFYKIHLFLLSFNIIMTNVNIFKS